jgi:hypothetical protein
MKLSKNNIQQIKAYLASKPVNKAYLFGSYRGAYEESLKYYRDLKNVVDTSRLEGIKAVAKEMKDDGEPIEKIIKYTNLSREEIDDL